MPDVNPLHAPTPHQIDQAAIVQTELLEVMSRLHREGIDWRVVLTGAGCAIADTVNRNVGAGEVPVWFARMSAMTMHMAGPG
jgi:hypothetical protein